MEPCLEKEMVHHYESEDGRDWGGGCGVECGLGAVVGGATGGVHACVCVARGFLWQGWEN